jgi:ABC-type transport system substrate-binding protein
LGYQNDKINELFEKAMLSGYQEERKRLYAELQHLWVDDSPAVVIFQSIDITGVRSDVKGFKQWPFGIRYGHITKER